MLLTDNFVLGLSLVDLIPGSCLSFSGVNTRCVLGGGNVVIWNMLPCETDKWEQFAGAVQILWSLQASSCDDVIILQHHDWYMPLSHRARPFTICSRRSKGGGAQGACAPPFLLKKNKQSKFQKAQN